MILRLSHDILAKKRNFQIEELNPMIKFCHVTVASTCTLNNLKSQQSTKLQDIRRTYSYHGEKTSFNDTGNTGRAVIDKLYKKLFRFFSFLYVSVRFFSFLFVSFRCK
jgi:hypothetical protein